MSPPDTNAAPAPRSTTARTSSRDVDLDRLPKSPRHPKIDCVQPFGTVEGDEGDALIDLQQN
jgi:hypothetical protein